MDAPSPDIITRYFPALSEGQMELFRQLYPLYETWNARVNLISRKDIHNLYTHHVLHSLAIAKYVQFKPDSHVLDLGTGGGFPGIPLAVFFPKTQFTLIDGTGKKITVVKEIAKELDLPNVTAQQIRAEEWKGSADFVVSRAVAPLEMLLFWTRKNKRKEQIHSIPNGLIALKGGSTDTEIAPVRKKTYVDKTALSDWFDEPYFEEKFLIYAQAY
jgi:16S rRNA (guanine527-N7)-methyltransferase